MATRRRGVLRQCLNALIYPAPDLPGVWIAHCLELDMISQGNSQTHALEMMADAIEMCAAANVKAGRPPFDYRNAPLEVYERAKEGHEVAIRLLKVPSFEVELSPHVTDCAG